KVTFPPGSLNAVGQVEVIVSPVDVSSGELQAFPGDFAARAGDGTSVLLETFSLMEITVLQNATEIPLAPGMTATLEFLLPASTSLVPGETVPFWYFDERLGLWVEDGSGTVGISSFDPSRLSVVGNVTHFTWWNCDRPISEKTCLTGTVLGATGNPAGGVEVRATGIDYNGTSFAVTASDGTFCVDVKRASQVSVQATRFGGASASDSVIVDAPNESASCVTGPCTPVPTLTLPAVSCISGDVRDAGDNPVSGLTVTSTTGGFATTDANGAYCLPAPSGTSVTLYVPGFPSTTVVTSPTPGDCTSGGCTVAPIRPSIGEACLEITVIDGSLGTPSADAAVTVYDSAFENVLAQGTTDATGTVCLVVSQLNIDVGVLASDQSGQTGGAFTNTGNTASCSGGGCVEVEVIVGGAAE
ncbi:MAG: carboxypeptidase-like regulatory domain-containing protein, partial [Verrucomicrobiales bacterium]|nr:carboxypeptidase-like regulatory domain-containing protein [Verrucomicrobiales bacterium]